jgi:Ca2+-binding RTX toxin-like protein
VTTQALTIQVTDVAEQGRPSTAPTATTSVKGEDGDDWLLGDDGNAHLFGGDGHDFLAGDAGDD